MKSLVKVVLCSFMMLSNIAFAVNVPVYSLSGKQQYLGYIELEDTVFGLLISPHLKKLPPGAHGFHIHECSSCALRGKAAEGHLDLSRVGLHRGPYNGNSHTGDLPVLTVCPKGGAAVPVLAPRLKLADVMGRSIMIDSGSDNYSDTPRKNGGGKTRIACGEIPAY